MSRPRAYLIDSSIYIFRAWFSLPDNWHTRQGQPVSAVYGYTRFLLEYLETSTPLHCAAAFDESLGSCYRNDLLPSYKSSRELPDEALAFQLEACRKVTEHLGIACFSGPRYEADDYLATLASKYRQAGCAITVMTRDKDLGQIIADPEDQWGDYAADVLLDTVSFADKFGVRPDQFADYLALVGDPVDDIPGVPGVGAKTAVKLLNCYDSLEGIKEQLHDLSASGVRGVGRITENLRSHWSSIELAKSLTILESSIAGVELPQPYRLTIESLTQLSSYLGSLGLSGPLTRRCESLIKRVDS